MKRHHLVLAFLYGALFGSVVSGLWTKWSYEKVAVQQGYGRYSPDDGHFQWWIDLSKTEPVIVRPK